MNRDEAEKIAEAVLYEGYLLYPYRRSALKNRQRWSFGILYPPEYGEVAAGTERSTLHAECLLQSRGDAVLGIRLRFLHLLRQAREGFQPDGAPTENWDEGVERSLDFEWRPLQNPELCCEFRCPAQEKAGTDAEPAIRSQQELAGRLWARSQPLAEGALKLTLEVANQTSLPPEARDRDAALLRSLVSAHLLLTVAEGEFASLLDPPDPLRQAASTCRNTGIFPVLIGEAPERDMLLCSPILLYDYPRIAPESAGDFYDATEIDEMLTLRILTLTGGEKEEMRLAGERASRLLERTEETARQQLMRTHGTLRGPRITGEP